jgi:hypothetical protein
MQANVVIILYVTHFSSSVPDMSTKMSCQQTMTRLLSGFASKLRKFSSSPPPRKRINKQKRERRILQVLEKVQRLPPMIQEATPKEEQINDS